jgi:extracellular factor (EF) 3-hydroxypalmitic acid methyl ester biosynthesis protein
MGRKMGDIRDTAVKFKTSQGLELNGIPQRLSRNQVVFELYAPEPVLRMSEVLGGFSVLLDQRPLYAGRAVVTSLIQSGARMVCEARLEDTWIEDGILAAPANGAEARAGFERFLQHWGKTYRVLPEFKVVIADIHSFLLDLRNWLEQVELVVRSSPADSRRALEREWMEALTPGATEAIGALYDRFNTVASRIEPELAPVHQAFGKRQLHPLILASPFVYRTLVKPLGYAGDYEMVNMMMRDPYEGASLFAKAFNVCSLSRPPILAHRNRLAYLAGILMQETVRHFSEPEPLKVLNVGCGPAHEIRLFLKEQSCSDRADFTLIDFNGETLDHVSRALADCKRQYGRRTPIATIRQSVQQMLKQSMRSPEGNGGEQFDLAYCAGLFDYLPDSVCRGLIGYFYSLLRPGGLLVVTNVDTHSSRLEMEYFLEWHLIYRDTRQMLELVPASVPQENLRVVREPTGINVCLEIRKPARE